MDFNPGDNKYVLKETKAHLMNAIAGLKYSVRLKADHLFHKNASSNVTIFNNRNYYTHIKICSCRLKKYCLENQKDYNHCG